MKSEMKPLLHSQHRQRGAAAIFAAVGMIAMLAAAAFAIDLGQLYVAKRDLQNMANLAALDVARSAGGCLAPDADRQFEANKAAFATIGRLGGQAAWVQGNKVDLGQTQINANATREFRSTAAPKEAFAFRLTLQRPMPTLVMPLFTAADDAKLSANAASSMAPTASFSVSSYVASVDPTEASILNNLLGNALGAPLALTVGSYEGLLASSVPLLNVADELVGESVGDLLTKDVQLLGLLRAIADALFKAGNSVASDAVDAIADVAPNETVNLLTAIAGPNQDSPEELVGSLGGVTLNALDLVQALAYQLGDPVLQLFPNITIPGLTSIVGTLEVGKPPSPGAGPALQDEFGRYLTSATSAQGLVDLDIGIALPLLGELVKLNLTVDVAETTAELVRIDCAARGKPNHTVHMRAKPSIARLSVNNPESDPLFHLPVPFIGGLVKVCWVGEVNLGNDSYVPLEFNGPFDPNNPASQPLSSSVGDSLGSAFNGLLNNPQTRPRLCGNLGSLNFVLNLLLGTLGNVLAQLAPVLNVLDTDLLDPLLRVLGGSVGGAHVSVLDVSMPPPVLIQVN